MIDKATADATWGFPFDPPELDAALAYAADAGLPMAISHEHGDAFEVLEIDARYAGHFTPPGFMVWHAAEPAGRYAVSEGIIDGVERRLYFDDIIGALRFCTVQRGADWPAD